MDCSFETTCSGYPWTTLALAVPQPPPWIGTSDAATALEIFKRERGSVREAAEGHGVCCGGHFDGLRIQPLSSSLPSGAEADAA